MILNYLRDIVKYTTKLGANSVKISGDNGVVTVEACDETNKTVVIKGTLIKPSPDLEGICGLSDLEWLTSYVNAYKHKDDVATVIRKEKTFNQQMNDSDGNALVDENGEVKTESITKNMIEEIHFARGTQMKNQYRVMDTRLLPEQPKFGGLPWAIEIEPTKQAIDLLSTQSGFGVETEFGVVTDENTLYLTFGSSAVIEFAYDVEGTLDKPWRWETKRVLDILKLSNDAECKMGFSDKGAMQITLNSGLAEYNYIVPAKAKSN